MGEKTTMSATEPEGGAGQNTEPNCEPKSWTVLTFLGGENNLSDEMVFALKAMKEGGAPPTRARADTEFKFNALVQFAAEYSLLRPPVRFRLTPGDVDGSTHADYEHTNPHDRAPCWLAGCRTYECELVDFLYWGIKNNPADHYFVIFSGHGNGIESNFLVKDTVPPQALTIKQLRSVLEHPDVRSALDSVGKDRIDILGFDSCLMSMVEVCYELRHDADLFVASQGSEANLGWPYKTIFKYLQDAVRPPDPEALAKMTVDCYVQYYVDFSIIANSSADLSVCDLRGDKIYRLKSVVDGLARAIMNYLPEKTGGMTESDPFLRSLIFAHWYAQTYRNDQYADLFDFCDVLGRNTDKEDVIKACRAVKSSITAFVHNWPCYTGPMYQYSHGVSVYFPWSEIYPPYRTHVADEMLDFLKDTCWLLFLNRYIRATRRPARPGPCRHVDRYGEKFRDKDALPATRGSDDPTVRAKNPPHRWNAQACLCEYLKEHGLD